MPQPRYRGLHRNDSCAHRHGQARTSLASQLVTIFAVVVPPLGLLSAMGLLWGVAFHWLDLVVLVGMYVVCAFGTTIGFHRYFTHKSFDTGKVVKTTLAVLGCMTMQGPLTQWVTDHRKHHALSDEDGDPHSPHVGHGDGVWGAVKGFAHAHVGWLFTLKGMERGRDYGKDLYADRLVRTSTACTSSGSSSRSRSRLRSGTYSAAASRAESRLRCGAACSESSSTSTRPSPVNSICHMFGEREYRSRDESRNNWLIAVIVFGEGWHNNHHAFPSSARHGLARWQFDVSWWMIRALEKLRLVWNVRKPSPEQMARRRLPAAAYARNSATFAVAARAAATGSAPAARRVR